ncbi:13556_t:CDS:2 [Dentiscutata erythropus]|uniref:13556_t:CDS:1 n=1 Tax=Dentiscutata erythropus TaxID=1348616 RepID=A0A9N9C1H9_9GLOM|nr:13556_t:CDS:2 [Dentiscutata erythropus]
MITGDANDDKEEFWISIFDNDYDESNLSSSESTNNNNESVVNEKYMVKDQKAKWPLNSLFLSDLKALFFANS